MLSIEDCWLITRPSLERPYCVVCGSTYGIEQHHVVPRSRTVGRKDRGPTVSLCKMCHVRNHSCRHITFTYDDGWYADGKRCTTLEVSA